MPLVSGTDQPRLRLQLIERLHDLLARPDDMAPPRWVSAQLSDPGEGWWAAPSA